MATIDDGEGPFNDPDDASATDERDAVRGAAASSWESQPDAPTDSDGSDTSSNGAGLPPLVTAALEYREHGWPPIPVCGKRPWNPRTNCLRPEWLAVRLTADEIAREF